MAPKVPNPAKSYDQAVARSRGEGDPETMEGALVRSDGSTTGSLATVGTEALAGMIPKASASSLAQGVADGTIDAAPHLLVMTSGDQITGTLYSRGTTLVEDLQHKGAMKEMNTYQLALYHPETGVRGPKVSILGGAQLDRTLPPLLGKDVIVVRGETRPHKGGRQQLTEFFVGQHMRPGNHRDVIEIKASDVGPVPPGIVAPNANSRRS